MIKAQAVGSLLATITKKLADYIFVLLLALASLLKVNECEKLYSFAFNGSLYNIPTLFALPL